MKRQHRQCRTCCSCAQRKCAWAHNLLNFVRIRESKLNYGLPNHTKHYCLRARQSKRKHHCLASLCSIGRFFGVCFKSNGLSLIWRHRRHSLHFSLFGASGATFDCLAPNCFGATFVLPLGIIRAPRAASKGAQIRCREYQIINC